MPTPDLPIRRTPEGLEIRLHVQPRAKKNEISGVHNGALKIKVKAPPVDDAANRAIIQYLAERLGISKSRFHILAGGHSRNKVLHINSISIENFRKRLDLNFKDIPQQYKPVQ